MNSGFLGPAIATVLTACGIETNTELAGNMVDISSLQQYLPLAVLKHPYMFGFKSRVIF